MRSTSSAMELPKRRGARLSGRLLGTNNNQTPEGGQPEQEREEKPNRRSQDALSNYCVNLNKKAMGREDRPVDRARPGNRADHSDPVPADEE